MVVVSNSLRDMRNGLWETCMEKVQGKAAIPLADHVQATVNDSRSTGEAQIDLKLEGAGEGFVPYRLACRSSSSLVDNLCWVLGAAVKMILRPRASIQEAAELASFITPTAVRVTFQKKKKVR
jgi:hypothetical protein